VIRASIFISIVVYLASLYLPVFYCPTKAFKGYQVLFYGWLGFIYLDPRWLANILYAWILIGLAVPKIKVYYWLPYLTIFLALSSIPFPSAGCESAGGAAVFSTELATGGYIWIAAISIACLSFILKGEHPKAAN
jgi:hypothetical protein